MKANILIVEDEEALALLLRYNLEAEGYEVDVVDNSEAALGLLMETPPRFDLVVLDPPYDMASPDLDGLLVRLDEGWLLKPGWTVLLTRGIKSSTPVIPVHWAVARQLRYGDSLVILYREVSWA